MVLISDRIILPRQIKCQIPGEQKVLKQQTIKTLTTATSTATLATIATQTPINREKKNQTPAITLPKTIITPTIAPIKTTTVKKVDDEDAIVVRFQTTDEGDMFFYKNTLTDSIPIKDITAFDRNKVSFTIFFNH